MTRSAGGRIPPPRAALSSVAGPFVEVGSADEGIAAVNELAAEHVQVMARHASRLARRVVAGAVLVGPMLPLLWATTASVRTHVLPTGGAARYSSPLSIRDFQRRQTEIRVARTDLRRVARGMIEVALAEASSATRAAWLCASGSPCPERHEHHRYRSPRERATRRARADAVLAGPVSEAASSSTRTRAHSSCRSLSSDASSSGCSPGRGGATRTFAPSSSPNGSRHTQGGERTASWSVTGRTRSSPACW